MVLKETSGDALVTCVIIFLNEQRFLDDAIQSVFAQSYTNWELLLIDDGSTDGSSRIARGYAERVKDRVRYFDHEGHQNRGMSASRNLALRKAKGKYISWLDGDDLWLPQKLEIQVGILEKHASAAMVYAPLEYWFGWTGKPEDIAQDMLQPIGVEPDTLIQPPDLLCLFLKDEWCIPLGGMVRREILERVGGFEEEFREMYEDTVVHAKVCLKYPVYAYGKCLYKYRRHPDSRCYVAYREGRLESSRPVYLFWLERYLSKRISSRSKVWKVLQAELAPFRPPKVDPFHKVRLLSRACRTWISERCSSIVPWIRGCLKRAAWFRN